MAYKTNLERNVNLKIAQIKGKYGPEVLIKLSSSERYKDYSEKEIKIIIELKKSGSTDEKIATRIGRSYWSVVYKISDLRKRGLLYKERDP